MRKIGYARVSTDEQTTEGQVEALLADGCAEVFTEYASGADPERPVLARTVANLKPGEVLVVVRIDRLARSVTHLLHVIDDLQRRGVGFKSLSDPIDTSIPQGRFTLQILGAVAEFERALIRERTVSGIRTARQNGAVFGNPGLLSKDAGAVARVVEGRAKARRKALEGLAPVLVPTLASLRPAVTWKALSDLLNRQGVRSPGGRAWDNRSLVLAARQLVDAGHLDPSVLDVSPRAGDPHAVTHIVAGLVRMNPNASLAELGENLSLMGQVTPRGSRKWSKSSVQNLLVQARTSGLLPKEMHDAEVSHQIETA